jgi:hypothetical protein
MTRRSELAFTRVISNLLLGGTAVGALISLMRIWSKEKEQREREK